MIPIWVVITALAVAFSFLLGVTAGRQILVSKSKGEALVVNLIVSRVPQPYALINNVTLPTENGTTQIDHVLVTPTGIFVIETKHYDGWIFGDKNASHWTQVIYKKKSKFQNPIRQNYGHLKALQSLFALPEDNFVGLVVFTGKAEFKTELGKDVMKLEQLIAGLTADRPVTISEQKMTYIVGRIEIKRLERSAETDEYHLNYVRKRVALNQSRSTT